MTWQLNNGVSSRTIDNLKQSIARGTYKGTAEYNWSLSVRAGAAHEWLTLRRGTTATEAEAVEQLLSVTNEFAKMFNAAVAL